MSEAKAFLEDMLEGAKEGWDDLTDAEQEVVQSVLTDAADLKMQAMVAGIDVAEREMAHIRAQIASLGSKAQRVVTKAIINTTTKYTRSFAIGLVKASLGLPPV